MANADDVSRGCANIYKLLNQNRNSRLKFIHAILRRFEGAASRSEIPYLCFLANVVSLLPYTTNDEVMYVVFHLNRIVSLRAAILHDALRRHLEEFGPLAAGKKKTKVDDSARRDVELSTILSLILVLKQYFVRCFELTDSRIHAYKPSQPLKTSEILRCNRVNNHLDVSWVDPTAGNDISGSIRQAKIFFALMRENADHQPSLQRVNRSEQVKTVDYEDVGGKPNSEGQLLLLE